MTKKRFQIEHLARLAKLEFSRAEKERYSEQLSEILDYVEQLDGVRVGGIAPTSQISGLKNVWRLDKREKSLAVKDVFKNAEAAGGNYFKVKKILEQE